MNKNGEFEEGEVFFYAKDHLNSVHSITDKTGKPLQRYSYSAYGRTKVEKTNPNDLKFIKSPYGFTSREWEEETGDYYYRARYYDGKVGRFLSEDPIGFAGGDVNIYRYVGNNPIRWFDPLGLEGASLDIRNPDLMNQSFGTQSDFLENYLRMRLANTHGADKYYHCMANCQAASRGGYGARTAEQISDIREWVDENIKGDPSEACEADQEANRGGRKAGSQGQSCSQICSSYGPSGY